MGYFENGFLGNPNSGKATIKEMLDVMDEDQVEKTLGFMRASFPDVEKKVRDAQMERVEHNIHYLEASIHELDNSRERMNDALYGNNAAIRRLSIAVIAFAAGWTAYVTTQIILSLV